MIKNWMNKQVTSKFTWLSECFCFCFCFRFLIIQIMVMFFHLSDVMFFYVMLLSMLKVVKIGWAIFANYEYFIIRMLAMAMAMVKWQRWFLTTFDKYKMNCICLEAMIWMIKSKGESREENVCNLAANWQWFISFYVWIFADRSLWLLHCLTSRTLIVNHFFNTIAIQYNAIAIQCDFFD